MALLDSLFGLSRKNKVRLLVFLLLILLYIYYIWYPKIIRYKDFGIAVPSGYSIHGIDVSRYQDDIVWHEVADMKSHGMQIDFAFIKATEGVSLVDPKFKKNWRGIHRTRIRAGAYHFYRCNVDPLVQANHFLRQIKLKPGDLAPVLDLETEDGSTIENIRKDVLKYLRYVENRLGVRPIIYTNLDFYRRVLDQNEFKKYPLWIAQYTGSSRPRIDAKWALWQYSESGRVNSIRSKVDFNVLNSRETSLDELSIP